MHRNSLWRSYLLLFYTGPAVCLLVSHHAHAVAHAWHHRRLGLESAPRDRRDNTGAYCLCGVPPFFPALPGCFLAFVLVVWPLLRLLRAGGEELDAWCRGECAALGGVCATATGPPTRRGLEGEPGVVAILVFLPGDGTGPPGCRCAGTFLELGGGLAASSPRPSRPMPRSCRLCLRRSRISHSSLEMETLLLLRAMFRESQESSPSA